MMSVSVWSHGGGGFGLMFLVLAALVVIPFWRILPRSGIHSAWSLAAVIPVGALILLWIVAFKDGASDSQG